jgi:hypothetical protein
MLEKWIKKRFLSPGVADKEFSRYLLSNTLSPDTMKYTPKRMAACQSFMDEMLVHISAKDILKIPMNRTMIPRNTSNQYLEITCFIRLAMDPV